MAVEASGCTHASPSILICNEVHAEGLSIGYLEPGPSHPRLLRNGPKEFLKPPELPEIYPEIWIDASGYLTSQPPPHIDDDDAYEDGTAHDEYEAGMATEL